MHTCVLAWCDTYVAGRRVWHKSTQNRHKKPTGSGGVMPKSGVKNVDASIRAYTRDAAAHIPDSRHE